MNADWVKYENGNYWQPFVIGGYPYEARVEWVYSADADDSICWVATVTKDFDDVVFEQMALTAEDAEDMVLGFIESEYGIQLS